MKLCALVLAIHHVANAISGIEGRVTSDAPTMSGSETSSASATDVRPTADATGVDAHMIAYRPRAPRNCFRISSYDPLADSFTTPAFSTYSLGAAGDSD